MLPLPIMVRELYVQARRPASHWSRFAVAGGTLLVSCILLLFVDTRYTPPHEVAKILFAAMGALGLAVALLAGVFLTADCLSSEKRENTLGLLFLTDLRGYDVVLGKLTASSLQSVYALLAIIPIMALPLLMGGVSSGEFWRMVLVLLSALFLSLTLGLAVSAVTWETRQAIICTLAILVCICGFLPLIWGALALLRRSALPDDLLLVSSPVYAYFHVFDNFYLGRTQNLFWVSLLLTALMSLLSLALACRVLPRVWQTPASPTMTPNVPSLWSYWRFGSPFWRRIRRASLNTNPYYWLAARDRVSSLAATGTALFTILPMLFFLLFAQPTRRFGSMAFTLSFLLSFLLHQVVKCLLALEASRRLSDDLRSGAMELLAVTPLRTQDILEGLHQALVELFRVPVIIAFSSNLLLLWLVLNPRSIDIPTEPRVWLCITLVIGILLLFADCHTLSWVGARMALHHRRHHRAILATILRVLLPPWLCIFFFFGMVTLARGGSKELVLGCLVIWWIACFILDIIMAQTAKIDLTDNFRTLIAEGPLPRSGISPLQTPGIPKT